MAREQIALSRWAPRALALSWLLGAWASPGLAQDGPAEAPPPPVDAPTGTTDGESGSGSASDAARDAEVFGSTDTTEAGTTEGDGRDADVFGEPADDSRRDENIFGAGAGESEPSRDDDIFGPATRATDAAEASSASAVETTGPSAAGSSRDAVMLGGSALSPSLDENAAPDDPLTIGGLMYLRMQSFLLEGEAAKDTAFSLPELAQLYFDVRPNERVRGFAQVRLQYDPTLPAVNQVSVGRGSSLAPGGSSDGVQSLSSAFNSGTRAVRFAIDQLWVNFDIGYRAFVTAGKVHDRWGTGRFWMPTDYLHLSNRNPINVFDSRTGTNMLKLHIPVESLAWNFYGYAVFENPLEDSATWGRLAGAFRAEFVLGTAELGAGIFGRSGELPRIATDLSFGIWDLDFYGELAVRDASVVDRVRYLPSAALPTPSAPASWQTPDQANLQYFQQVVDARYPAARGSGMKVQAVGGVTYSAKYDDDDIVTVGAEYFYNQLGYADRDRYPGLLLPRSASLQNAATFFYLGRHYLAVFATLPSPFALDLHTFTLSTLGNLSDLSFISRFDYRYTLLTHLGLEAFVAVHYGRRKGEFRFGSDPIEIAGVTAVPGQPPALLDLGLAVRLEF